MRKKILYLLTLLALLACTFAFAACVNTQNENASVYTVRFNNNYDGTVTKVEVEPGGELTLITPPTRVGYTFEGWYLSYEEGATEKFDETKPITQNLTVYAKWAKNTDVSLVTLKYLNFSTEDTVIAVNNGTALTKPADPEYDSNGTYKFEKWYTDKECTQEYIFSNAVNGDLTLYAGWTQAKTTVKFDANFAGAPAPEVKYVELGKTVERPADPVRNLYEFSDWYTERVGGVQYKFDSTVDDKDGITLYAHWLRSEYVINFNANGARYDVGTTLSFVIKRGESAQSQAEELLTKLTYTGHDFAGWYMKAYGDEEEAEEAYLADISSINDDVFVYAKWNLHEYDVAFDYGDWDDAPAVPETQQVKYGKTMNLPQAAERDGYTFLGWYTDDTFTTQITESSQITGDMTLVARWYEVVGELKDITVTFVYTAGGSQVTHGTVTIQETASVGELLPDNPSVNDYYFTNWYVDDKFTAVFNPEASLIEDTTVYGKMLKKYTFEAEKTDLSLTDDGNGHYGAGSSTNMNTPGALIMDYTYIEDNKGNENVSGGYFVRGLYYNGGYMKFDILADEDVDDAVLFIRVSSECYKFKNNETIDGVVHNYISDSEFKIMVNGQWDAGVPADGNWLEYGRLDMLVNLKSAADLDDKALFQDQFIAANVHLNKGLNFIELYVDNNNSHGGTFAAEAPMIDCIHIYSSTNLELEQDYEYYTGDDIDSKL